MVDHRPTVLEGPFRSGLELARRFYHDVVGPSLQGTRHAAALLGDGSEVLGFDDDTSTDHAFGPRVQVFLPEGGDPAEPSLRSYAERLARSEPSLRSHAERLARSEPSLRSHAERLARSAVHTALAGLPERFEGYPVAFAHPHRHGGRPDHQIEVTTAAAYFSASLGVDPDRGMSVADWLLTPTQQLASLTGGAVFHDPDGVLARRRQALAWYPDDVWRYVLAAGWLRIEQEEAFVGRAGGAGDELGSAILAARLARELVRLAFLVARRWAPYGKWLGRAFAELPLAVTIGPHLRAALTAPGWREREASIVAAASALGAATNALRLAEPVDPHPRQFHSRDIRVVAAGRFTQALTASITDPELRVLLDRLGARPGATVGVLPGAIDQTVDSVDILCHPDRCRATAAALGLPDAAAAPSERDTLDHAPRGRGSTGSPGSSSVNAVAARDTSQITGRPGDHEVPSAGP